MGNKLEGEKENSKFSTPKKLNRSSNEIINRGSDISLRKKEGLYSEEKLFENFESIYKIKLKT